MKLMLYDSNLTKFADLSSGYTSCLWREEVRGLGSFCLELPATPDLLQHCRPGIFARRKDRKTVMAVQSVEYRGQAIILTGLSAAAMLAHTSFVGRIQEGRPLSESIPYAYSMCRPVPHIGVTAAGVNAKYMHQISNKSMLDLIQAMCDDTDTGYRAILDGGRILIEVYTPQERPDVKFSRFLGNLQGESYMLSDAGWRNYAIVLGQGEGPDRVRVDVDQSNGQPIRELLVDARGIQQDEGESLTDYKKRLEAAGAEKLQEQQQVWTCSFEPLAASFGTSYDLGDVVTAIFSVAGLKLHAQVAAFTQKAQGNQVKTSVEIGRIAILKR